jgi:hypothetical protein
MTDQLALLTDDEPELDIHPRPTTEFLTTDEIHAGDVITRDGKPYRVYDLIRTGPFSEVRAREER